MDDYLDVFGDVEQFGKKHAGDIFEKKKPFFTFWQWNMLPKKKKELDYWYSKKPRI